MKISLNSKSKGAALVVLIVAMTLIAVLGAAFVSIIGSKQKGFLHQKDSYRAFNIANAGIEYAIRYMSDGLSDVTNPNNKFIDNPTAPATITFGGGTFTFTYDFDNNRLLVNADYPYPNPVSKREIALSHVRYYLSSITLDSDPSVTNRKPTISATHPKQIVSRLRNNENNNISISRIILRTNLPNKYLKYIYIKGSSTVQVFDYESISDTCIYPSAIPCKDTTEGGIYLPANSVIPFYLDCSSSCTISGDSAGEFILEFTTNTSLSGSYNIVFNPQLSPPSGSTTFGIP